MIRLTVCFFLFAASLSTAAPLTEAQAWAQLPGILERIQPPTFPEKAFVITKYGAKGNGETDCTEAFRKAIDECSKSGGGRVVVPAGTWLTGAIHLKSNVNLYLEKDALISFFTNTDDYLPVVYTRFEGVECLNFSPLVYAFEQENIAITGGGTLDGNAGIRNWWRWKWTQKADVAALCDQAEAGIPVEQRTYGQGRRLRPNMIQPYRCKNILIESVTIKNSPMWHIHPVLSENITVRNVTVVGHGPNNDGCNPESCKNVLIENCWFDTGDDCIAIKSGRNADGRRVNTPSENIVVRGCTMKDGHGGVVIGSEISGSVRNVFAEDCVMDSPNLDRGLRIKTNSVRGGVVENIFMRNVTMKEVGEAALKINFYYQEGPGGDFTPTVRNIFMTNVICHKSKYPWHMRGYDYSPIQNVILTDCVFENIEREGVVEAVEGFVVTTGEDRKIVAALWSDRMVQSVMRRNPEAWQIDFASKPKWTYTNGLVLKGIWLAGVRENNRQYLDYVQGYYDTMIDEEGKILTYKIEDYNIDMINPGQALINLYNVRPRDNYLKALRTLRGQMEDHPRTSEGGFWHKKRYPHQMWLDGLFMGAPFLAHYGVVFNEPELFDEVTQQIILMNKHARDDKTGLLYHGWDESREQKWADPETGCSPNFWGRALGWYAMGLVDTLDFVPRDHPRRGEVITILNQLVETMTKYQDPDAGVWYQVVDQGGREGNYLESSCSTMMVYAMFKGVRNGYLPSKYLTAAKKGYQGILDNFIEVDPDGVVSITHGCSVAGLGGNPYRDGSYEYYLSEKVRSNDPKAVGPFILASLEYETLRKENQ